MTDRELIKSEIERMDRDYCHVLIPHDYETHADRLQAELDLVKQANAYNLTMNKSLSAENARLKANLYDPSTQIVVMENQK